MSFYQPYLSKYYRPSLEESQMACNCNYSCAATSMSMMVKKAYAQKRHQIIHNLQTKGVAFSMQKKEPEIKKNQIKYL